MSSGQELSNPSWKIAVTYQNDKMTDGVGAQLQRIYGIYALSRLLKVPYIHSPLAKVDYQGLKSLEENSGSQDFVDAFNRRFTIKSDVAVPQSYYVVNVHNITPEAMGAITAQAQSVDRPIIVRISLPYGITDAHPACYECCREISPFSHLPPNKEKLRVAVHVRRGEMMVVAANRMLPNDYYIKASLRVSRLLEEMGVPCSFEIHTEIPTKEVELKPGENGIEKSIGEPKRISPEESKIEEFAAIPNATIMANAEALDCLSLFSTADVLITSRSSFSYLGGMLNRKRSVILYNPFWHPALPGWISTANDGTFDEAAFRDRIQALMA
ncbi:MULTISPECIES: hypothetical protein [unclassified Azospirillum]|uniref:hypothetical protein n=1 Tax=unclassified Azospirillum TaxID=2630922 RepID=UPI0011B220D8|nr:MULTISPECIES: hypothetical protein [unclassified Azospirillum]